MESRLPSPRCARPSPAPSLRCLAPWRRCSAGPATRGATPSSSSLLSCGSRNEYGRRQGRGPSESVWPAVAPAYTRPVSRQQRLTLVATILGSTIVFLDSTVVNVALPAISDGLDAKLAGQQWVVEAYLLTLVSLMLVGGSLGDQFGRRRMFVGGLIGFGITSALCAVSPSVEFLIGARALQGV